MKKFLIILFIFIALGGTVFFFGWVQFSVPPGQYGVIISKTHGIESNYVKSGEFRWIWYKLLPTNVKIAVFNIEHEKYHINFKSTLPSGDTYASFVGASNANFSWNLTGEISFKLNPDSLVNLTEKYNLASQADLENHLKTIAQDIELIILRSLSTTDSLRLEQIMSGNTDMQMEEEIKTRFPEILDFTFLINSAKFPDFILYNQIRLIYEDFLIKQREFITSSFGTRAEYHINAQLRFEELSRYGELLTKYPILLEYLAIEHNDTGN